MPYNYYGIRDVELRLMSIGKSFALAAPRLQEMVSAMHRIEPFLSPEPEPEKPPKHHSHLIEAHIRKTRRPR
jgi:hypothetical protein